MSVGVQVLSARIQMRLGKEFSFVNVENLSILKSYNSHFRQLFHDPAIKIKRSNKYDGYTHFHELLPSIKMQFIIIII